MAKELKIRITGDATGLRKAADDSVGVLEGFGQKIGAFSVAAGTLLADGIKTGFTAAVGFLGDSIGAAGDLNESMSKVQQLFGDSTGAVVDFAAAAATELGQSKQQALDAASTFATFGKAAGLGADDLLAFSTANTRMASDFASFFNTDPAVAIEKIGAAFRGEAEPIREFGILLDADSVKAKAVSLGLVQASVDTAKLSKAQETAEKAGRKYAAQLEKFGEGSIEASDAARDLEQAQAALSEVVGGSIPDLTAQQKILATQQIIMEQGSAAMGDFGKTSGGLANQQRILAANVENLKARIGQGLLPIALRLTSWVNTALIPAFSRWITDYGPAIEAGFRRLAGWVQNVAAVFQQGGWTAALGEVGAKLKELWLSYMAWFYGTALPWVASGLADLGRKFGEWVTDTAWPWLVDKLGVWLGLFADWFTGTALPWLGDQTEALARQMGDWIVQGAQYLRDKLPVWIEEFTSWFVSTALPWLIAKGVELSEAFADWVADSATKLITNLPGWLKQFDDWIRTDALPAMTRFGISAAGAIKDAMVASLNFMADIASAIVDGLIDGLWSLSGRLSSSVQSFITSNIPGPVRELLGLGGGGGAGGGYVSQRAGTAATYRPPAYTPADFTGGTQFVNAALTAVVTLDGRQLAIATAPYTRQLERSGR